MSGVVVVAHLDGTPVSLDELEPMARQAAHRGPDGITMHVQDSVGFAHLALWATQAAKRESQPLVAEGGRLILVADARVDNRDELGEMLGAELSPGEACGDATMMLAAWRRWREECARRILGDFAMVVWEAESRTLFAARDALGVNPLHYARFGNVLCVTSEAQQILRHPACPRRLDEETIARWILGDLKPDRTPFAGVQGLPAGHWLTASPRGIRTERYWDIEPARQLRYKRVSDYAEHLRDLLRSSVAARLRGAGPVVGSEMSGGMDSTTVTALARGILRDSGCRHVVFTWWFPTLKECDESRFVGEIEARLDLDVRRIDGEDDGGLRYPVDFVSSLESPGVTVTPQHAHVGAQLAGMGGRVLLTGNGGDELTWGNGLIYPHRLWRGDVRALSEVIRYCRAERLPVWPVLRQLFVSPHVPAWLKRQVRRVRDGRPPDPWPEWFPPRTAERLGLSRGRSPASPRGLNAPQRQIYQVVVRNMLRHVLDSYTYALGPYGVEARHPFLDRRIAEFVFAVPVELWLRDRWPKWLLRQATEGLLPDSVRWRPDKTAFSSYFLERIARHREHVELVLADPGLEQLELVDTARVLSRFRSSFTQHPRKAGLDVLWVLATQSWFRRHRGVFTPSAGGENHE